MLLLDDRDCLSLCIASGEKKLWQNLSSNKLEQIQYKEISSLQNIEIPKFEYFAFKVNL